MKVEQSTSIKLTITEVEGLDPITVHLEDYAPGRGAITIRCGGSTWGSGWGAMGQDRDTAKFVTSTGPDYLIGCFAPMLHSTRFSSDKLVDMAKRCILDRRRNRNRAEWDWMDFIEYDHARRLFNAVHDLHGCTEGECNAYDELLSDIFGSDWRQRGCDCQEPNPDYFYLERITEAVQAAIKQMEAVPA